MGEALGFLAGLDNGQDQRYEQLARDLVNHLFVLIRSAGMHDLANEAMERPFVQLAESVNIFMREGYGDEVSLTLVDGNLFVNKRLVRLDYATFQNARYLRRIFEFLGINEFLFTEPIDRDLLRAFLQAFLAVVRESKGQIGDFPLTGMRLRWLDSRGEEQIQLDDANPRDHVLKVYAHGMLMLRQFVNDLRRGRSPRHAKVKRLCLQLIDVEPRFHAILLSLVHLEAYKGNLFSHMLNTAILALVFGHRLGLRREQLVDLGMAAFHHDLGWALLGTLDDGRQAPEALDMEGINYLRDDARTSMDDLRVKVARSLVRLGGFNELVVNRLIVAYECQIPEDAAATGLYYGEIDASFMTQVVRIGSTYDELTSRRSNRAALLPDQAMRRILDDGGKTFDEFLAKLFANSIGAYPVGTMVELDTTEVAVVVNLPRNPINYHRPQVKVLVDRMGRPLDDGPVVDLGETQRGGSRYLRTIERTLDSRERGLSITRFFFG